MDENPRTGLAVKVYNLLLGGILLLTAIIDLISKVVNYHGRPVPQFRL